MPEPPPGDKVWLRDLLQAEVKRLDEKIAQQNAAIGEATKLAAQSMDKRLDSMNEFRQSMSDLSSKYQTREEAGLSKESIEKRVSGLEKIVWGGLGALALVEIMLRFIGPK